MYDVELTLKECIKDIMVGLPIDYAPKPYTKTMKVYDLCNLICKNSKLNEQELGVHEITEVEVDNIIYRHIMVFRSTVDFIRCLSAPYITCMKERANARVSESGNKIHLAWADFRPCGVKAWYLHCLENLVRSFVEYKNFDRHSII